MLDQNIPRLISDMLKTGSVDKDLLNSLPKEVLIELIILEFNNLYNILSTIKPKPGSIPNIKGFDIYGASKPNLGGDHIIYLDFEKRFNLEKRLERYGKEKIMENQKKAGILVADVSGHSFSDSVLAAQFHQAFLIGAQYELTRYGEITLNLFEELNTRFARTSRFLALKKYITAIYGEIWEEGKFKYVSAGHPIPIVFSKEFDNIVDIGKENKKTGMPIGFMPSKNHVDAEKIESMGLKEEYVVNELKIFSPGDILIIYTDGLSELYNNSGELYFHPDLQNTPLERKLREVKHLKSKNIWKKIYEDIIRFQPNPEDDLTYVIIKKEY